MQSIYESIKNPGIKTSVIFNLVLGNKIIYHFFFLFIIIKLYVLIPAVTGQFFNPTTELVTSVGIPTKEPK